MRSSNETSATRRRTRPALLVDLPVAILLLVGFFTVPVGAVGHVAAGTLFVAAVVVHLVTRRGLIAKLWRSMTRTGKATRVRITNWTALVAAVVMTVSGFVQWAGVPAMIPVHSTSSYLLILAAGVHIWQHWRALVARARRPTSATADEGQSG